MRSLTYQTRVSVNLRSPPTSHKLILFTAYSKGESVATIRLLSVLYLRPLTAFVIAGFHQSNQFRIFCNRFLRIVKSAVILINIKKYFTREKEIVCMIPINSMILIKILDTIFSKILVRWWLFQDYLFVFIVRTGFLIVRRMIDFS